MTPTRTWYESLSVECILALDEVLGDGAHSDASFEHLAKRPQHFDFSAVEPADREALEDALEALRASLPRFAHPVAPEVDALLDDPRWDAGTLSAGTWAPGRFRLLLGDVEDAAPVEVDGRTYPPLGQLASPESGEPVMAWLVFDPADVGAPIHLACTSDAPLKLADSLGELLASLAA